MLQSYYNHPLEERFTWYSNDGITKRVLDYILVENFVQQYAEDCKVENHFHFDTDHRLLIAYFNTPKTKNARWKPKKIRNICLFKNQKSLKDNSVQNVFLQKISNQPMPSTEDYDVTQHSEAITTVLNNAALESLPQRPLDIESNKEIWKEDLELNNALNLRATKVKGSEEHKLLNKHIKKRVRQLKNSKLRLEANEINSYATKRDMENLF